jgi:hypothetical protein
MRILYGLLDAKVRSAVHSTAEPRAVVTRGVGKGDDAHAVTRRAAHRQSRTAGITYAIGTAFVIDF